MSQEYERFRTRMHALYQVIDEIEAARPTRLPWDGRLAAAFGTPDELLHELHACWHRKLAGRLEPLVERGASVEEAVHEWRQLAAETPGVRALLESAAAGPALREAGRQHAFALACAAGLAAPGDDVDTGARAWRQAVATGQRRDDARRWWWCRHRPLPAVRVGATA